MIRKKQGIRRLLWMLAAALLFTGVFSTQNVQAGKLKNAWMKIKGVCYNGSGDKIPGVITRGIDVSLWQDKIDWTKVKKSNVDFAFVRICHGISTVDRYCETNLTNANLADVPVGTYVYSMAKTENEAILEAQLAIRKMNGHKISYPVVLDLEDSSLLKLSSAQLAKVARAFLNEIQKAGYYPMIYCNTYWYTEKLVPAGLTDYDIWLARFGDTIQPPSTAAYRYTIWQATDGNSANGLRSTKGLIDGIPVYNDVDLDFGFVDYTQIVTARTQAQASYVPTKAGWITSGSDKYYYIKDEAVTGWYKISGKKYYFDEEGRLQVNKRIRDAEGNISFTDENGVRVTKKGWYTLNKKKYYILSTGYAARKYKKIGGKYYYFHKKWGYLYYINKKVVTSDKKIYYFDKNGARYNKGFLTLTEKGKEKTYYFGKNGAAYKGWKTINKKKYFFYTNGVMAKSRRIKSTKKGYIYVFDSDGVLTQKIRIKK